MASKSGSNKPTKSIWIRAVGILMAFVIVGFGTTAFGLVNTIFVKGEKYSALAEKQQLLDIVTKAKRGNIYDRNMNVLATSATVWQVYASPNDIDKKDKPQIAEDLAEILSLGSESKCFTAHIHSICSIYDCYLKHLKAACRYQ